jgi:hypothetical protein
MHARAVVERSFWNPMLTGFMVACVNSRHSIRLSLTTIVQAKDPICRHSVIVILSPEMNAKNATARASNVKSK